MAGVAERGITRQPQYSARLHFTYDARMSPHFGQEQALGCSRFIHRIATITTCSKLSRKFAILKD